MHWHLEREFWIREETNHLSAQSRKGVLDYLCGHGSLSRGVADRRKTLFLDLHIVGNHFEKKRNYLNSEERKKETFGIRMQWEQSL